MIGNQTEVLASNWHWRDILKTYQFWGLALILFLLATAESFSFLWRSLWFDHSVSFTAFLKASYLGVLVAGLLSIYFLRTRIKAHLVGFTLLGLFSFFLINFGPVPQTKIYLAAFFFKDVSFHGIVFTVVAALVTAKLPLRSFLVVFFILVFCIYAGYIFGGSYVLIENNKGKGDFSSFSIGTFYYHLLFLIPSALGVLAALFLKSIMFFEPPACKAETIIYQPMNTQPSEWLWQDLVSTYRFWGLVLVGFFISFTQYSNKFLGASAPQDFIDNFGRNTYGVISYLDFLVVGFLSLYVLKGRIKTPLLLFSVLFLASLSFIRFGFVTNSVTYVIADCFRGIGYYGVMLTILTALITVRLPIKSFLIASFIIVYWAYIGQILGDACENLSYAYGNIEYNYRPIYIEKTPLLLYAFFQFVAPVLPVALAIFAAAKLKSKMFSDGPNIEVQAKAVTARESSGVFAFSLIVPFYFLYWLFKQPSELKTLAPDMHQPSPVGIFCVGLFAPFILPIWFHDVRKGLGAALNGRTARRIGLAAFFVPAIAAGMAQSDCNHIVNRND